MPCPPPSVALISSRSRTTPSGAVPDLLEMKATERGGIGSPPSSVLSDSHLWPGALPAGPAPMPCPPPSVILVSRRSRTTPSGAVHDLLQIKATERGGMASPTQLYPQAPVLQPHPCHAHLPAWP
ncbi:hypothetical protein ABPG77_001403 [Micractinium sp. CCAP 211/92]